MTNVRFVKVAITLCLIVLMSIIQSICHSEVAHASDLANLAYLRYLAREDPCDLRILPQFMKWNEIESKLLEWKKQHGTTYGASRTFDEEIDVVAADIFNQVLDGLKILSIKHRTRALIYGATHSNMCVWLIDPNGLVAKARMGPEDTWLLPDLWSGLNVVSRSHNRAPISRSRSQSCPDITNDTAATADVNVEKSDLESSFQTLRDVSKAVLPELIARALINSGQNERLLIIPAERMGQIPFAALPIGNGTLIDRYAIVVSESVSIISELGKYPEIAKVHQGLQPPLQQLVVIFKQIVPSGFHSLPRIEASR